MHINANGSITKHAVTDTFNTAQPVFMDVKNICSIFLDNSIKMGTGYLFNQESMSAAIKQLTRYLQQNTI